MLERRQMAGSILKRKIDWKAIEKDYLEGFEIPGGSRHFLSLSEIADKHEVDRSVVRKAASAGNRQVQGDWLTRREMEISKLGRAPIITDTTLADEVYHIERKHKAQASAIIAAVFSELMDVDGTMNPNLSANEKTKLIAAWKSLAELQSTLHGRPTTLKAIAHMHSVGKPKSFEAVDEENMSALGDFIAGEQARKANLIVNEKIGGPKDAH